MKKRFSLSGTPVRSVLIAACSILLLTSDGFGNTYTWMGGATGGGGADATNLFKAANWSPSGFSANNNDWVFTNVNNSPSSILNVSANATLNSITFGTGALSFTLTNPTYQLKLNGGTNLIDNSASVETLSVGIILAGNAVWSISTGAHLVVNGVVSDGTASYGITTIGGGTLDLNGANTFNGGVKLMAGTLAIGHNAALGTGTLTFASNGTTLLALANLNVTNSYALLGNATFDSGAFAFTNSGVLSGAGGLTKTNAGSLVLSGVNTYTGGTILGQGTITLRGSGSLGATNGAVLVTAGTLDLGGLTRTNSTFTISSGVLTNGTLIAMTYALNGGMVSANLGGGTINVGGISTLAGTAAATTVNVNFGMLTLDGADRLASTASVNVSNGATLNLGGFNQTLSTLTGTGSVTNSAGTLTLSNALADSFAGTLLGSGALAKTGDGTLALAASNSYSGGTTILAGGVFFTGASALGSGPVSLSGGNLSYSGLGSITLANDITVTSKTGIIGNTSGSLLTLGGTLAHSGSILGFYGGSYNVTGKITGTAASSDLVLSNAAVTLSSAADYSGSTRLLAGSTLTAGLTNALPSTSVLTIGGAGESSLLTNNLNLNGYSQTLGGLYSGTGSYNHILNSAGTTATLTLGGDALFGGSINGNLSLTIANATVTLTGNNSYTGATTLHHSSLSLTNGGFLSGTTGILVDSGSTLLLGGNNQINKSAALILAGGVFSMGAATPGSRAPAQTFASLTLTANSVIDFGALPGTSSLTFGSISGLSTHSLNVYNWNGTTLWGTTSATGGTAQYTHLLDSSSGLLSTAELSSISFYSGLGTGFLGTGGIVGNEIIPVPEPSVLITSCLLIGILVFPVIRNAWTNARQIVRVT